MNSDIKLNGNAVIVEGSLGLGVTDPARPMHVENGELHSGGRLLLGRGEPPMTVENESSNETPRSEDEAGPIVRLLCGLAVLLSVSVASADEIGRQRLRAAIGVSEVFTPTTTPQVLTVRLSGTGKGRHFSRADVTLHSDYDDTTPAPFSHSHAYLSKLFQSH